MKRMTMKSYAEWAASMLPHGNKYSRDTVDVCVQLCETVVHSTRKQPLELVVPLFWAELQKRLWRKRFLVGYRL